MKDKIQVEVRKNNVHKLKRSNKNKNKFQSIFWQPFHNKHATCTPSMWIPKLVRPFDISHTSHTFYCAPQSSAVWLDVPTHFISIIYCADTTIKYYILVCLHYPVSIQTEVVWFSPAAIRVKPPSCLQMCVWGFCGLVEFCLQILQLIPVLMSPMASCTLLGPSDS